ncbi:MAG: hypothetical protein VX007_03195, partial [Pseudomonadota bacterium]|nr:hypothetical protein [Pseudomonadota bacterium]
FERMPFLIKEVEETLGRASKHGIQVDPTSLQTLTGVRRRHWTTGFWVIAAAIIVIATIVLE